MGYILQLGNSPKVLDIHYLRDFSNLLLRLCNLPEALEAVPNPVIETLLADDEQHLKP